MKKARFQSKLWLIVIAVVLTAILSFSLSACSVFTDAIKGLFGNETQTSSTEDPIEDPSGEEQEKDPEQTEDPSGESSGSSEDPGSEEGGSGENGNGENGNEGSGESGSGSEGSGGSGSGEQGEENKEKDPEEGGETFGSITFTSSLTYDKASASDFSIEAIHDEKNYYALFGAGLTNDTMQVTKNLYGSSSVLLDGEYLTGLPVGSYDLCYAITDGYEMFYEYFTMKIVDSKAKPQNVKIDYDVDCPSVYVTWSCSCGGAHSVTYDKTKYAAENGSSSVLITSPGDKRNKHTATVSCSGGSTSVEKPSPANSVVSGGYLSQTFDFMGRLSDRYVEDRAELAHLYQYLIYEGEVTEMTVGISSKVLSDLTADASQYLSSVQSTLVIPWNCRIGCSSSSGSNVATFRVYDVNAGVTLSSNYASTDVYVYPHVSSHYAALSVRDASSPLPIDEKKGVFVRNVKELLAAVQAGYRPIAEGDALDLYNKARNFCITYLSDDMTDTEKLHVIYDYLAGEIAYDYSALNLFNVVNALSDFSSLDQAKSYLNAEMASASNEFSLEMKAAITSARDEATTLDDLIDRLKSGYLQRLSAFSAEGVFNDGSAVCEGISYSFMLLARIEGIECNQVTGYASNGGSNVAHAWNKAKVGDKWYAIDATWGNVSMKGSKFVTHRYFMLDEAAFYENHVECVGVKAGVTNLATGNAEYYKSAHTSGEHTLFVEDYEDLFAAVSYYVDAGSPYIEIAVSDSYDVMGGDSPLMNAIMEKTGKSVSLSYIGGSVILAYYTLS